MGSYILLDLQVGYEVGLKLGDGSSISSHLTFCTKCGLLPKLGNLVLPTWVCPSLGPSYIPSGPQCPASCVCKLKLHCILEGGWYMCHSTLHTWLNSTPWTEPPHPRLHSLDNAHHTTKNSQKQQPSAFTDLMFPNVVPGILSSPLPMKYILEI